MNKSFDLVHMCPICRRRIEFKIDNIRLVVPEKPYYDKSSDHKEYYEEDIESLAILHAIYPLKCRHGLNTNPIEMVPVPKWVPGIMDKLKSIFPDMYKMSFPHYDLYNISLNPSTSLHQEIKFNTHMAEAARSFSSIAAKLLDEDSSKYNSICKIHFFHSSMDTITINGGDLVNVNTIRIFAPCTNFMDSNDDIQDPKTSSYINFIEEVIRQYNALIEQLTIGGF